MLTLGIHTNPIETFGLASSNSKTFNLCNAFNFVFFPTKLKQISFLSFNKQLFQPLQPTMSCTGTEKKLLCEKKKSKWWIKYFYFLCVSYLLCLYFSVSLRSYYCYVWVTYINRMAFLCVTSVSYTYMHTPHNSISGCSGSSSGVAHWGWVWRVTYWMFSCEFWTASMLCVWNDVMCGSHVSMFECFGLFLQHFRLEMQAISLNLL